MIAPTKKTSYRGFLYGQRAYFIHDIARRRWYNCYYCNSRIEIGQEHTVLKFPGRDIWDHHHIHSNCVEGLNVEGVEKLKSSQTTMTMMNKKSRNLRNKRRRK